MSTAPYLSLVAVSRNDDHGGNTLQRTQVFVDGFLEQCARYQLPAELILVEWNPPADKKPLAEAIDWRLAGEFVDCRVITVGEEYHNMLAYSRKLPLFQMIGKNVGIRRARGEFILATNIDILFSEELFSFLAARKLRTDRLYRCDRFDVEPEVADPAVTDKMEFAWSHLVRKNRRLKPWYIESDTSPEALDTDVPDWMATSGFFDETLDGAARILTSKPEIPFPAIHGNACGDFTLLHRDGWNAICGYAELEAYSLHIDSLGIHCAHRAGYLETWLAPPLVCFHIEHALGSGYLQTQQTALFDRLASQGIGWFNYHDILPLIEEMEAERKAIDFNDETWGMRDITLPESRCTGNGIENTNPAREGTNRCLVNYSALKEAYEPIHLMRRAIAKALEAPTKRIAWLEEAWDRSKAQREELLEKLKESRQKHQETREKLVEAREKAAATLTKVRSEAATRLTTASEQTALLASQKKEVSLKLEGALAQNRSLLERLAKHEKQAD